MLRPIKYSLIALAAMFAISPLAAVQARTKYAVVRQKNRTVRHWHIAWHHRKPAAKARTAAAPAAKPVTQVTPAANGATNASATQTAAQQSTQQLTTTSQNGTVVRMSSGTYFDSSSMSNIQAAAASSNTSCSSGSFNSQFLCLINDYRASLGLHSLVIDGTLNSVGQNYAAYMNSTGIFSHTADGKTFLDRCAAAGTTCWAENLARGATSPQTLFEMWKASPGHNANMVNPSYRSMGLGESGSFAALYLR